MKHLALVVMIATALSFASAWAPAPDAQARGGGAEPVRTDGAQLFKTWCASCHGLTGQGNGALAPMLKQAVPDLTQLAAKNGGVYPTTASVESSTGRRSHRARRHRRADLAPPFVQTAAAIANLSVRARIDASSVYLEGIRTDAH